MPIFFVYATGPDAQPAIWQNDFDAMTGKRSAGWPAPDVLHYPGPNPALKRRNWAGRDALAVSQKLTPSGNNTSLDEYPYASVLEGGASPFLHVAYVPPTEQSDQGGDLSSFYGSFGYKPLTYLVVLVP